jgi:hypothetical protein
MEVGQRKGNVMRTLTEIQAYDALVEYLRVHSVSMGKAPVEDLYDCVMYNQLTEGRPWPADPGEWGEWVKCVDTVLARENSQSN